MPSWMGAELGDVVAGETIRHLARGGRAPLRRAIVVGQY